MKSVQNFVDLDLGSPVFVHGQFYVAISRVTSRSNIEVIWNENNRVAKTQNVVYKEVLLSGVEPVV
jgi:hypothetical protein